MFVMQIMNSVNEKDKLCERDYLFINNKQNTECDKQTNDQFFIEIKSEIN